MMMKCFAVAILVAQVGDAVWTALIAAAVAVFMEWNRRSTNAVIKDEVAVVKKEAVDTAAVQDQKLTGIAKATDGYLSKVTEKFETAMRRVEILEARLTDQAKVISDKDKVIGQVIAGASVLSGSEGKVGAGAPGPLASIKATVEDTNERVQVLEKQVPAVQPEMDKP